MKKVLLFLSVVVLPSMISLAQTDAACQKKIDSLSNRINYLESNMKNSFNEKLVQAGLTTNLGMNFIVPGQTKLIDKNGVGSCFSIGLAINKTFKNSPTIGIATGIEFDFETNRYKTVDSVLYDFVGSKITNKANEPDSKGTFYLQERNQKSIYVSIPLMMLFRTSMIGDFRYFGKFGIRNSFLIKNTVNDLGIDVTDPAMKIEMENKSFSSPGDMFFYKGSIGLSAGAEWKFISTTSLVAEVGYFYGITPLHLERKESNRTLYTEAAGTRTYFSNKANQNQLLFKISILF
jgi:hypothetical protein